MCEIKPILPLRHYSSDFFRGNLNKHEGGGVRVGGSRVSDYVRDQQNSNPLYIHT